MSRLRIVSLAFAAFLLPIMVTLVMNRDMLPKPEADKPVVHRGRLLFFTAPG
jgi:hypothetical protein